MITFFRTIFLGCILTSALVVYLPVQAQEAEESVELQDQASSTDTVSEAVVVAPWYTIEKLIGEVNNGDFVIGPGRAELVIRPGETKVQNITITNRISDDRTFQLQVEDIVGTDDASSAVTFLGEGVGPQSLKNYISFPEYSLVLDKGERAVVPVTITVPLDAEPGGYYGGVLVSTLEDDGQPREGLGARSPIVARIGTLFFVTVPGTVLREGAVKDFSLLNDRTWYTQGPVTMNILFENTGSVHLNPYGELRIRNLFGEEVGFVEVSPWFVLPQSLRTRSIDWNRELLFGRYTATLALNRGYDDVIDEQTVVFYVIPWKLVGVVFGALFMLIFIMRLFLRNFEFKRRP